MFGLGTPELIVIFAIIALLFGGQKLPEIGANIGKAMTGFKKGVKELEETLPELATTDAQRDNVGASIEEECGKE